MPAVGHRIAIYSRVSTSSQDTQPQFHALETVCRNHGWNVVGRFEDLGISGAKGPDKRPQLRALLAAATRKEFDRVVVWSVDRLGRSLRDLVLILKQLEDKKIELYSHSQGIDTSTVMGRMMWQFLAVFSEFEREMIRERVRMGLDKARASGKTLGRPGRYQQHIEHVLQMRRQGMGILKIARSLRIGTGSVKRILREAA